MALPSAQVVINQTAPVGSMNAYQIGDTQLTGTAYDLDGPASVRLLARNTGGTDVVAGVVASSNQAFVFDNIAGLLSGAGINLYAPIELTLQVAGCRCAQAVRGSGVCHPGDANHSVFL